MITAGAWERIDDLKKSHLILSAPRIANKKISHPERNSVSSGTGLKKQQIINNKQHTTHYIQSQLLSEFYLKLFNTPDFENIDKSQK